MANIWENAISILAGNLNFGHSYLMTTVQLYVPGCSFWLGENSPESRILLAEVEEVVVRPLLLEDAATDVTTVGCTVAVGGATTPSGAATPTGAPPTAPAADGADALEAVLPPGEADRISGPAGW